MATTPVSAKKNKVKFGLENVYYALMTADSAAGPTYGEPKRWPGAVSLSMDPQGDVTKFRADNVDYWVGQQNSGYEGDLEMARVIDDFRKDVLGEEADANGVLVEDADAETKQFALLFEFAGDVHKTRHVLYNCTASRPSVGSQTTEETKEPVTESCTITASPLLNKKVKSSTTDATEKTVYDGWFQSVYLPGGAANAGE